jgi:hypothetical protein
MRHWIIAASALALVACPTEGERVVAAPTPYPEATPPDAPSDDPDDWPGPADGCGLATDLANPHFIEGDRVQFGLTCTGERGIDEFVLTPIRVPQAGDLSTDPVTFDWQTGPADGGRYDLVFGVRPSDEPDAVPSAEQVTFWVADDPTATGNVRPIPEDYTEEWGIPVFHVDSGGSVSQSYTQADITFQGRTYDGEIKVRGASSTSYPKKSYTMEFNGTELPVDEWGVTRDHLYLVTTFDDNSYIRQKLIYDQWAAMGEYWEMPRLAPRTFFAVLYLNGTYHGLYTAIDRIDNEFVDHMGFARDCNLYKSINHDANFYYTRANGSTKGNLHNGYEKKEGLDGEWTDLDAFVDWAAGSDAQAVIDGAAGWFSLQEFMDWFLLVHYSESGDSAGKNAYFHNDPLTAAMFSMTPWDFNHAWGQGWYTYRISSSNLNSFDNRNRIFRAIHEIPASDEELWTRFRTMRADGPFALTWMHGKLDEYYALIDKSAARDWAKWEGGYYSFGRWAGNRTDNNNWTDYEAEKAYLYQWIEERHALFLANHPD